MASKLFLSKPLGEILLQANLVSASQIEEALREQSLTQEGKIGEILARKGWIKQETADFFAHYWHSLVYQEKKYRQKPQKPLGYYLRQAGLLDEQQIRIILGEQEQGRLWVRLGASAAMKGWIKQSTVDFFVEHLFPEYATDSPFVKPKTNKKNRKPNLLFYWKSHQNKTH
jgi:hypothetical protein